MTNWKANGWSDFFEVAKKRKVVIWGAGRRCKELLPYFLRRFPDLIVVDKNRIDEEMYGLRIKSPEILASTNNAVVLIMGQYTYSIKKDLENINPHLPCFSEWWIEHRDYIEKHSRKQPDLDMKRVEKVCDLLTDQASRDVLTGIANKRKVGIADYSDIRSNVGYFPDEIIKLSDNEVYIDCGVFNGDTIKEFIDAVDGKYDHIFAYEADIYNYKRAADSLYWFLDEDRISLFNFAVSDNEKEIFLHTGLGASSYSDGLDDSSFTPADNKSQVVKVDAISLDHHLKEINYSPPTFIKMDIEGCEIEALNGAKEIIKEYNPKLAICIYHREMDFLDIPELIHSLVPEYKLFIRHQGMLYFDTVLFATL